ncbi:hypothetical protein [Sorangium sp. So ce1335]|uniref:hypothetical protein n=1 Tax=Sorangium sp. So ce1335 TaxID=3133335 RepID=UPI003F633C7A
MVHRFVSGLGSLLLATLDPSAGAAFAATAPAAPVEVRSPQTPGFKFAREPDDEEPQPSDPQCGACAAYVLQQQRLYLYIGARGALAQVRLDLYSQAGGLIASYAFKPSADYTGGAIILSVPGGPMKDTAVDWGAVRWIEQTGAVYQIGASLQERWSGWRALGQ